jgi:hypothetical protein
VEAHRAAGEDLGDEPLEGGGAGIGTFNHWPKNLSLMQL